MWFRFGTFGGPLWVWGTCGLVGVPPRLLYEDYSSQTNHVDVGPSVVAAFFPI